MLRLTLLKSPSFYALPPIGGLGKLRNHNSAKLPWPCTYPKPVHKGHDLGCDFLGILLPYGVQDDISQEKVALPGIEYLLTRERKAKKNDIYKKQFKEHKKGCGYSIQHFSHPTFGFFNAFPVQGFNAIETASFQTWAQLKGLPKQKLNIDFRTFTLGFVSFLFSYI